MLNYAVAIFAQECLAMPECPGGGGPGRPGGGTRGDSRHHPGRAARGGRGPPATTRARRVSHGRPGGGRPSAG